MKLRAAHYRIDLRRIRCRRPPMKGCSGPGASSENFPRQEGGFRG